MDVLRKLPIGMQNLENLRSEGFIYIDKTRYIYDLAHYGKAYFLSRPRRFGGGGAGPDRYPGLCPALRRESAEVI